MQELTALHERLLGPRPRLRTTEQVQPVVDELLKRHAVAEWLRVTVKQCDSPRYRQVGPGRPGQQTKYVKQSWLYCELAWELDPQALAAARQRDGIFPLITNTRDMRAEEVLRAYKRQPIIEKRFSQLKTDFSVAPIYLKSVSRIQALLCVYFFSLMLQTLLERELRQAMHRKGIDSLPLYPEQRPCTAPTTRRIIDVFEPVQRHLLQTNDQTQTLTTDLTPLQHTLLELLGMSSETYAQ
jgi:transposase